MSTYKFPYRTKRINLGSVVDPLIQLELHTSYGWQSVWMLVDTGADTTTLPLSLAKTLGIPYNTSQKEKLYGIGDETIYGYSTKIQLKINDMNFIVRTHLLDTQQHVLLLGRMDVFDKFTLIFDNQKNEVQFKKI